MILEIEYNRFSGKELQAKLFRLAREEPEIFYKTDIRPYGRKIKEKHERKNSKHHREECKITCGGFGCSFGRRPEQVGAEIKAMEEEGVICAYHTLINWDSTQDERVDALIEVKVTPQRGMGFDSIAERIYQYEEVDALYLMSGAFDFTVIVKGRTMKEVANFVSMKLGPMESVLSTATHFVLKRYKDHGTKLVAPKKDERMQVSP